METRLHRFWDTFREYVTHWSVTGAILAATGAAPEHWLAELFHDVPIPHAALSGWLERVDYRLMAVVAGLTIIVGDTVWRNHHRQRKPVAADLGEAHPSLPDRPSIAVLPFDNVSGDREQEYFSDGVADDIITELSHDHSLFVIARNSSFSFKARSINVKQIAAELGVRYILEGSVRRDGGRLRVNARLIDATTGNHIWAERYDRVLEDVFAIQDEITMAVSHEILPAMADAERRRVLRKPPENLNAWENFQRGLWHMGQIDVAENQKAKTCFRRALQIDPDLSAAHLWITIALIWDAVVYGAVQIDDAFLREAISPVRKAVALDPANADAQAVLAWASSGQGASEESFERASKAVQNRPNSFLTNSGAGIVAHWSQHHPAEARTWLTTALRINPRDPLCPMLLNNLTASYYQEREYKTAVEIAKRAISDFPKFPRLHQYLAAALGQLGRLEEAREALRQARAVSEDSLLSYAQSRAQYIPIEYHEHMLEGLRKAGWTG